MARTMPAVSGVITAGAAVVEHIPTPANDSPRPAPHTAARMPRMSLRETTSPDWLTHRRPNADRGQCINSSTRPGASHLNSPLFMASDLRNELEDNFYHTTTMDRSDCCSPGVSSAQLRKVRIVAFYLFACMIMMS